MPLILTISLSMGIVSIVGLLVLGYYLLKNIHSEIKKVASYIYTLNELQGKANRDFLATFNTDLAQKLESIIKGERGKVWVDGELRKVDEDY